MKTVRAWSAVVLLAAVGCGGGGGGSPSTVADFCMQYATDVCQISASCGIQTPTCVSHQVQLCTAFADAAVSDAKRVFTPGNMGNCLNKVKSAYTGTKVITPSDLAAIDLACNYVFQGKVAQLTAPCISQYDCAGPTDGSIICDAANHVCAPKTTVSGTKQCNDAGDVCAQDYYCAPTAAGSSLSSCMADATMGASCATVPCNHTTHCVNGLCAALAQAGEACTTNADCGTAAPYCNVYAPSATCSAGLQFAASSVSCTCIGQGVGCPTGTTTTGGGGTAGGGAGGHSTGAAGAAGSAGGAAGSAGGAAGGAAGAAGGAAGAAGGASGAAGGASGAAGAASDSTGIGGLGGI